MLYQRISIPDPCHEKWSTMPNESEGHHCAKCNTVVFDFSELTDNELQQALKNGKHHCGRFTQEQLDKVFYLEEERKEKRKYWSGMAAAIVAGMLQLSTAIAQDHKPISRPTRIDYTLKGDLDTKTQKTEENKFDIKCKIENSSQAALMNAYLNIEELAILSLSDQNGDLRLSISNDMDLDEKIRIVISKPGYRTKILNISLQKFIEKYKVIPLQRSKHRRHHRMGKFRTSVTPSF